MQKRIFNTIGFCNPEKHYVINPLRGKETEILNLIERENYFVMHAPRQTGKTTFLHSIVRKINEEGRFISMVFSIESAGYTGIDVGLANKTHIESLYLAAESFLSPDSMPPKPDNYQPTPEVLQTYLSDWAKQATKPLVIFIDEIDSIFDNVLVSVLRQLRNGFQFRPKKFPASIALVGMRDVREYKTRVREDDRSIGRGSPFNIKAESYRLENFTREEVAALYAQYTDETGQEFPTDVVDLLYDYTGGQPWLVNALAREITEKILKSDYSAKITIEIAQQAKENLIKRRDTHLDSLVDKLHEPRVRSIVSAIITGGSAVTDNYNDDLLYVRDLGIVIETKTGIKISNNIYAEIIPRVLTKQAQDEMIPMTNPLWFVKDGKLQMDSLLKEFQKFYRRHSESWMDKFSYQEAGKQLLLMAYLQRIINGGGQINREMALGKRRCDLEIIFGGECHIIELKIKYDNYSYEDGLEQLSDYLDKTGQKHGYLMLFEEKKSDVIPWDERLKWYDVNFDFLGVTRLITVVEM